MSSARRSPNWSEREEAGRFVGVFTDDRGLAMGASAGAAGMAVGGAIWPEGWILMAPLAMAFGYATAALWLNRTEIHIDAQNVSSRVGPVPWLRRSRQFARGEVSAFAVRVTSASRDVARPRRAEPPFYGVDVVTTSGERVPILDSATSHGAHEVVGATNAALERYR